MTQEEHLECSHQTSNSVYEQVNDDLDKSKNIVPSNQVSEARSNSISGVTDATGNILYSGGKDCEQIARSSIDNDNSITKVSEVKPSDQNNNLEMTVITHQGSGENIREIQTKIENSEKSVDNTNLNENSEITERGSEPPKEGEDFNLTNNNKNAGVGCTENKVISIKNTNSEKSNKISDSTENEDPLARLNALKANISNALKEVKAVLSEHGEPTNEPEKDEIKPAEEDAVRFRFVRRIRKKSIFDEEDKRKSKEAEKEKSNKKITLEDQNDASLTATNICATTDNNLEHFEGQKALPEPKNLKELDQSTILEHSSITVEEVKPGGVLTGPDVIQNIQNNSSLSKSTDEKLHHNNIVESFEEVKRCEKISIPTPTPAKSVSEVSSNENKLKEQIELQYQVKVVETVSVTETPKVCHDSELTKTTNKNEIACVPKTIPKVQNEDPKYEVKVVDVIQLTELPQEADSRNATHSKAKKSDTDVSKIEKKQKQKVKNKTSDNELTQIKTKSETKKKSEKNEGESAKAKKIKTESETTKKGKRNSKEISKTDVLKQEEKQKNPDATNGSKSKSKKSNKIVPVGKLCPTSEKSSKITIPSEDIIPTLDDNVGAVKSKEIAQETEPLPETVTKLICSSSPSKITPSCQKEEIMVKPGDIVTVSKKDDALEPKADPPEKIHPEKTTENASLKNLIKHESNAEINSLTVTPVEPDSKEISLPPKLQKDQEVEMENETDKISLEENKALPSVAEPLKTQTKEVNQSKDKALDSISITPTNAPKDDSKFKNETSKEDNTRSSYDNCSKSGPTSALDKVLAITNLKVLSELRPPLPPPVQIAAPLTTPQQLNSQAQVNAVHNVVSTISMPVGTSSIQTNKPNSNILPALIPNETSTAEKLGPSLIVPKADNNAVVRRHSLPTVASSKIEELKTLSTQTQSSEKIISDSQLIKTSNQNFPAAEVEKDKLEGKSQQNDVKMKSEKESVNNVKIPLKIDLDKVPDVAKKPKLTSLPSPFTAVQLAPLQLKLIPISTPHQIQTKKVTPKKGKSVISSQTNESSETTSKDDPTQNPNENSVAPEKNEKQASDIGAKVASVCEDVAAEKKEESCEKIDGPKKRKAKKKVVIKRIRRRLSTDGSVPGRKDSIESAEPEICEKELKPVEPELEPEPEPQPEVPSGPKSCIRIREFQPDEIVMYNDRIKKVSKWKKAVVLEKITSISYKLNVEGEEKSCHVCYMKKYTGKKVQFGGKEYLEIDYAQEEDDEEEEEYNIWARV